MAEFAYDIKIPKERVAVLIGSSGKTKKELEEATKVKITVDSKDGSVLLEGDDALDLYAAKEVIRAVGRGFNPEIAKLLLKQDTMFEIISIADYVKNKNQMQRLKGRVIGSEGKTRSLIEELTECYICIYGKTISIIGTPESVVLAKRAIDSLLAGATHSSVYMWLEKKRREIKRMHYAEM